MPHGEKVEAVHMVVRGTGTHAIVYNRQEAERIAFEANRRHGLLDKSPRFKVESIAL